MPDRTITIRLHGDTASARCIACQEWQELTQTLHIRVHPAGDAICCPGSGTRPTSARSSKGTPSTPELPEKPKQVVGVGMPVLLHLERFGVWVDHAYGTLPYLVGSAAVSKTWRDVDVRLILADEDYDRLFPGGTSRSAADPRWTLACAGLSALAKEMTGLPVDFQIQRRTDANKAYAGVRVPLGMNVLPDWPAPSDTKEH